MLYILDKRVKRDNKTYCTVYDTDDNTIESLNYIEVRKFLNDCGADVKFRLLENYDIKKYAGVVLMYPKEATASASVILRNYKSGDSTVLNTSLCGKASYMISKDGEHIVIEIECSVAGVGLKSRKTVTFSKSLELLNESNWQRG